MIVFTIARLLHSGKLPSFSAAVLSEFFSKQLYISIVVIVHVVDFPHWPHRKRYIVCTGIVVGYGFDHD